MKHARTLEEDRLEALLCGAGFDATFIANFLTERRGKRKDRHPQHGEREYVRGVL